MCICCSIVGNFEYPASVFPKILTANVNAKSKIEDRLEHLLIAVLYCCVADITVFILICNYYY